MPKRRYGEIKRNAKQVRKGSRAAGTEYRAIGVEVKVRRSKGHYRAQACFTRSKFVYRISVGHVMGHRCGSFAQGRTPTRAVRAALVKLGKQSETRWREQASRNMTDSLRRNY